jgi:hypothetical protein
LAQIRQLMHLRLSWQQMDPTECEQYRAANNGDREAFELNIRTHSRTLFAIAYAVLQNCEEADDVVQHSLARSRSE